MIKEKYPRTKKLDVPNRDILPLIASGFGAGQENG
jgi:hypothetical protein